MHRTTFADWLPLTNMYVLFFPSGDVTSVLMDTTNLEQVREEAKERRKRRKKKRSGSTLVASVFSGEFIYLLRVNMR